MDKCDVIDSSDDQEAVDAGDGVDGEIVSERCTRFENLSAGGSWNDGSREGCVTISLGARSALSQESGSPLLPLRPLPGKTPRSELGETRGARGRISSFFKDDVFRSHVPSARPRSSLMTSVASSRNA